MGSWSIQNLGITWRANERWLHSELTCLLTHIWQIWPMEFPRGRGHEIQEYLNLKLIVPEN